MNISVNRPLLVPAGFFLTFIIEGVFKLIAAFNKSDTIGLVATSIGLAISIAGVTWMINLMIKSNKKTSQA